MYAFLHLTLTQTKDYSWERGEQRERKRVIKMHKYSFIPPLIREWNQHSVLPWKCTARLTACHRSFMLCQTVHACSWECVAVVVCECQITEKWPVAAVLCMCVYMYVWVHAHTSVHVCRHATRSLSVMCVCVCTCVHVGVHVCICYLMLLLTCFSYNCNCWNTFFFFFLFSWTVLFSHVTLVVCFKANPLLRTMKYYLTSVSSATPTHNPIHAHAQHTIPEYSTNGAHTPA